MKTKNVLELVISVLILAVISSCSDNSTSTTTTPPGTVFYSQDSIAVWLQPTLGSANGTDSLYYATVNTGGVKVEFTVQSNADSTHSVGNWSIYTNASPAVIVNHQIIDSIDSPELINLTFTSGSTYFALAVRLNVTNSAIPYYIRLKNVKITKT